MRVMRSTKTRYQRMGGVLFAALFVAACASVETGPIQRNIGSAETAISQAETRNAAQHAPLELTQAQEKLDRARAAFDEEEYRKANYLAEEALVDANLADAKSQTAETRETVEELRTSIARLREEIEREAASQ